MPIEADGAASHGHRSQVSPRVDTSLSQCPVLSRAACMPAPRSHTPEADTPYGRIYAMVRQIPYGEVATYGQIARLVGRCTARMVGYAMAGLPFGSDVPWHRVINYQGRISPRAGSGSEIQRQRLAAEGVRFSLDGRIDLACYRWVGPELEPPVSGRTDTA